MKIKIQINLMFFVILLFVLLSTLIYAGFTTLLSPVDDFIDDDGFLDLKAKCEPTSENNFDGTTLWNVTNATLYTNVSGSWKANKTIQIENPIADVTHNFDFINIINQTGEGVFIWNVLCQESNSTNNGMNINKSFADNRTVKVKYAKASVTTTSPVDGHFDPDGQDITIVCLADPTTGWNITKIELKTNISLVWKANQTFDLDPSAVDDAIAHTFILNAEFNRSGDGTNIVFGCSAFQVKNDLEGVPETEKSSTNRTLNMGIESCTPNTCDRSSQRWCNSDREWTGDNYCNINRCGNKDSSFCSSCTGNVCDTNEQKWCEGGEWKEGTTSQYCLHCGQKDNTCPICESGVCDTDNKNFCDNGAWTKQDYCSTCGDVDESCNKECVEGTCDTTNRKLCKNKVWEDTNYCLVCAIVDSSCSVECTNNACDVKNQKWCDDGTWTQVGYCDQDNCGEKDVSCGLACENRVCDQNRDRWCNVNWWATLSYCSQCSDTGCSDKCTNNACDINSQRWCDDGTWKNLGYCNKCGNKDSTCSPTCVENTCDTTSNKICTGGQWTSQFYCDSCGLKDSDCTLICSEGECDTVTARVCTGGKWVTESYVSLCKVQIQTSESCKDFGNCAINISCTKNSECGSEYCSDKLCTEPTCNDKVKNGGETDVDCGGNGCDRCINGQECRSNSNCVSRYCSAGTCSNLGSCKNKKLDVDETDIDCGGSCSRKCQIDRKCDTDKDCASKLICSSKICSDARQARDSLSIGSGRPVEALDGLGGSLGLSVDERDTDGDGIPDLWEIENGLNLNDPSDASLDFDQDGLINLQEFSYGTNPNLVDTDGDGVSDKEEIDKGTDPLVLEDKPGASFGLLFLIIMMLILLAGGGYGAFYYFTKIKSDGFGSKFESLEPMGAAEPGLSFSQSNVPRRPSIRKTSKVTKISDVVKKRRLEKEEKREKLMESFGRKRAKPDKKLLSIKKEKDEIDKLMPGKKDDVFSELKTISKKLKEKKK